jgi:hypothetical protein
MRRQYLCLTDSIFVDTALKYQLSFFELFGLAYQISLVIIDVFAMMSTKDSLNSQITNLSITNSN